MPDVSTGASSTGDQECLPPDLPHWVARGTASIVIAVCVTAALASVLVDVPETVTCNFVLASKDGSDPIRANWRGVVEGVTAEEGREVRKGEVLYRIRSSEIAALAAELATLRREEEEGGGRLSNLRKEHAAMRQADADEEARLTEKARRLAAAADATRKKATLRRDSAAAARRIQEATIAGLAAEIPLHTAAVQTHTDYAARIEDGRKAGGTSWVELFQARLAKSRAELDLGVATREEGLARLKLEQMEADRNKEEAEDALLADQFESEQKETLALLERTRHEAQARAAREAETERGLGTDLEKQRLRAEALTKSLAETEQDVSLVTAPFDAVVLALKSRRVGDVVERGQELCQLARTAGELRAELTVPNAAAGRLRPGMEVKLLYEAFPYQRFGVRQGRIDWVSQGAATGAEGAGFRALAEISDQSMGAGEDLSALRPGMGGEARVVVGRRTLIEHVFAPLKQVRESMR